MFSTGRTRSENKIVMEGSLKGVTGRVSRVAPRKEANLVGYLLIKGVILTIRAGALGGSSTTPAESL